ncbi:peptide-binding protein [Bacteroidales bacterium]|nr:peptide-binding protein [Bacteroidales bacterium]
MIKLVNIRKRNIFTFYFFILIAVALNAQTAFYVSPQGADSNQGNDASPFASIERAQLAARKCDGDVVIYLRGGTYYLLKTLVFTAEDSKGKNKTLIIKPFMEEKVSVSGGKSLKLNWTPYKNGIMQAKIPSGLIMDQLLVNGTMQRMARYPNYDSTAIRFGGTAADAIAPKRVKTWKNPAGGFLHVMHKHDWGDFHYQFAGKNNAGELTMEGGWQNNRRYGMHDKNRMVENIFEELDQAGEWYCDATTHTLYFFPTKELDLKTALIEVPQLKHLFEFRGTETDPVKNISIQGLKLSHTLRTFMEHYEHLLRSDWTIYRGGAIVMEGTENCAIRNCKIENLGGNGIFFTNYNRKAEISGCEITLIGASAICFVGDPSAVRSPLFDYDATPLPYEQIDTRKGPKNNNYPAQCLVYDNLIHAIGTVEKQISGVELSMCRAITVSHNSIYDTPRAAINISEGTWGGHIVEYNDLFETVKETGDHGSFNSWGRDRFWRPDPTDMRKFVKKFPEMILADAIETVVIRNNRLRCDRGWDIDLDDGSSNYHIYNNLCLNGGIKLREGFNRVVENNILINNTFHPHVWFEDSRDIFTRNIVMSPYSPISLLGWGKMIDYNIFTDEASRNFAQQNGLDKNSIVETIEFGDPSNGNFHVKDNSEAVKLGFLNFSMDKFGVLSPHLKAIARTPVFSAIIYYSTIDKSKMAEWQGVNIKNLETLGERSATGMDSERGVYVVSIEYNSPLRDYLKANDVILEYNGNETNKLDELFEAIEKTNTKKYQTIIVFRGQKQLALKVPREL